MSVSWRTRLRGAETERITARVVSLGLCARELLQSLIGSWTSIFLLRRRTLSLMQICLRPSWIIVGPVCVADLGAQVLEAVYATDASDDRIAAVRADLPARVASEVYRHALQKGTWSRLLSEPQAWFKAKGLLAAEEELPGEEVFTPHPLWRILARSLNYEQLMSRFLSQRS